MRLKADFGKHKNYILSQIMPYADKIEGQTFELTGVREMINPSLILYFTINDHVIKLHCSKSVDDFLIIYDETLHCYIGICREGEALFTSLTANSDTIDTVKAIKEIVNEINSWLWLDLKL